MTDTLPTRCSSLPARPKLRLRLGARASTLSIAQSTLIARQLECIHSGLAVDIVPVATTGDQIQDRPLHDFGGKGLFTKQLEKAILDRTIDFAVHSYKDVPVTMPLVDQTDLVIAATPIREDPRDVLVASTHTAVADLPKNANIGTGSLRRKVQLLDLRPDLRIHLIRGNIDTRIAKLRAREFDAIVLAAAGLLRAKLFDPNSMAAIPTDLLLPAAAQGALALQCRAENMEVRRFLAPLDDPDTSLAVSLEREVVRLLNGDCHSPIGAYALIEGDVVILRASVARRDGTPPLIKSCVKVPRPAAAGAPAQLLALLERQGASRLLAN